jgi:hypothetical protein
VRSKPLHALHCVGLTRSLHRYTASDVCCMADIVKHVQRSCVCLPIPTGSCMGQGCTKGAMVQKRLGGQHVQMIAAVGTHRHAVSKDGPVEALHG